MNSFSEFTRKMTKLESEAWDWIIRLDSEEALTERDKELFKEWLDRSPDHIKKIRQLNEFWGDTVLTELLLSAKVRVRGSEVKKQSSPFWHPAYSVVFVLMFGILGSMIWLQQYPIESTGNYATVIGQYKDVVLPDDTLVTLNSDSQLKVTYSENSRDAWLVKGEASFQVKADKHRPFNVYAENRRVKAVGTSFTVDITQSGDVNVLVTEGRIALAVSTIDFLTTSLNNAFSTKSSDINISNYDDIEDIAYLNAGDFIELNSSLKVTDAKKFIRENTRKLSMDEIKVMQSWQHGELIFQGETLKTVVEQLKRYTTLDIEITDPSLNNLKIGGRFSINQLDLIFKNLELNFNLEVRKTGVNKIKILKKTDF